MAISIVTYPSSVIFAGNPVEIKLSSDTADVTFHLLHVRVSDSGMNTVGEDAKPLIGGFSVFDIGEMLRTSYNPNFSVYDFLQSGIIESDILTVFNIEIFETYNNDGIEHGSITGDPVKALNGGIDEDIIPYFDYNRIFSEFLTNAPGKNILADEHDSLFFLTETEQELKCRILATFQDNSTSVIDTDLVNCTPDKAYRINSSFIGNSLFLYETSSNIKKYEISIINSSNVTIVNSREYIVQRYYFNNIKSFFFRNSFGAYDFISLKGTSETKYSLSRDQYYKQESLININSRYQNEVAVNSGWLQYSYLDAKTAQAYIKELLNSKLCFEIINFLITGIKILNDTYTEKRSMKFNNSFVLEYAYTTDDELYSDLDSITALPDGIGVMIINYDFIVNKP